MAKNNNSNKGWGGPFDFNGDGKTTWDEEAFGLTLMDQCRKNNNSSSYTPSHRTKEPKATPTIMPVPKVVDENNYSALLSNYRAECISAIIATVLFLAPAALILWAVYSTYDPNNSASDFLTILFTVAGLIYGGVVLSATGKSISTSLENMELVKDRYSGPVLQKSKKKKWWLWVIIFTITIGIIFATSREPAADPDVEYAPSYNSYSSNSNSSYSSEGATKKINTTPAMTKEEAEKLRGTGYHGTRPNSSAENMELKAAQVKCKTCGMHSDNGVNSQCDACAYNEKHGLN